MKNKVSIIVLLVFAQKILFAQGTLWTWGDNKYGQLGLNNQTRYNTPQQVGEDLWLKVVNGNYTTFGIKSNGTLWAWGYNKTARLGLGNYTEFYKVPQKINNDTDWADISTSSPFGSKIIAIKSDGSLWVWGDEMSIPTKVNTSKKWKKILLHTDTRTIAEQNDGSVWGWGYNNMFLGGNYLPTNFLDLDSTKNYYATPVLISSKNDWKKLAGTSLLQIGIKTDGTLWAWGRDYNGELGLGFKDKHADTVLRPTKIGISNDWKDVIVKPSSVLAIKNDGTIWSWGYNANHELGLTHNSNQNRPQQIKPGTNWKEIFNWGAISDSDSIFVWGRGDYGQLGLGSYSNQRPTAFDNNANWDDLQIGNFHSTGLRTSNPKCDLFTDSLRNDTISINQQAVFQIAKPSNTNIITIWEGSTIDLWSKLEQSNRISIIDRGLWIKESNISNHKQNFRAIRINTENNCKDTTNTAKIILKDTCINIKSDTQLISVTDTLIINVALNTGKSEFDFIKIYPNPANDYLQIVFGTSVLQKGYSLNIINELGKSVYSNIIKDKTTSLNLKDWTGRGVYYVQIINDVGEIISIKHIILQ